IRADDRAKFFFIETKRLLTKNIFARVDGSYYLRSVEIMSRGNNDCVDAGVIDDRIVVGRAVREPEPISSVPGMRTIGSADSDQSYSLDLLHSGQQSPGRKAAGAKESDVYRLFRRSENGFFLRHQFQLLDQFSSFVVSYQNSESRTCIGTRNKTVSALCLMDRESVSDKRPQIKLAFCEKTQKGFHVARLRPADVPNGIVATLLLIRRVIAAWPIGARNAEIKLLLVVQFPLNIHANRANCDNHAAIPR